jgi:hypothetical protein
MVRALSVIVVSVLLVSACAAPSSTADQTAEASSVASPASHSTPLATPTVEPTPEPTPEPEGELVLGRKDVFAWGQGFGDYVSYQVIVELRNTGGGWAQVSPFNSDYTILGRDGGVVTTGTFTYAYPEFIGPGETGYLVEDNVESGVDVRAFDSVEVDGRFDSVDEPDVTFEVRDISLRGEDFGDGLTATGFVTANQDVEAAAIAVICFDNRNRAIGATTTNLLQNLSADKRKGFQTVTATPPLEASDCRGVDGYAQDTGF